MKRLAVSLLLCHGAASFSVLPKNSRMPSTHQLRMSTRSGMMDAHEILGVSWYADMHEIKAAYRQLAKQYHPDANPGRDTTVQFQEINRAYQLLREEGVSYSHSNDDYRDFYYGQEADLGDKGFDSFFRKYQGAYTGTYQEGRTSTGYSNHDEDDLHDTYFGTKTKKDFYSWGSSTTNKRPSPAATVEVGRDVQLDLEIDAETSVAGGEVEVRIRQKKTCDSCIGYGVKLGVSQVSTCTECSGKGTTVQETRTPFGSLEMPQTCTSCGGSGKHVDDCCTTCAGMGTNEKVQKLIVTIPPGVESGNMLCVKGEGDSGKFGGPAGDLYIFLTIKENDTEWSDEVNSEEAISYVDSLLRETLEAATKESLAGTSSYRWHNGTTTTDLHP